MPGNPLLGNAGKSSTSTPPQKLGVIIGVVGGIAALTIILFVIYFFCFHHRANGNGHLPHMSDIPMPHFSKTKVLGTKGKKKYKRLLIEKSILILILILSNCCGNYLTFYQKDRGL